ncbi:MAG: ABC transporter permease [Desulfobacterales bacterium]
MDLYILLLLPDFSQLQLLYHSAIALILSTAAFLLAPKTTVGGQPVSIFYHLFRLKNYKQLWLLWARYNVKVRYTQTVLGITWIALIPLLTAIIMSFVFSQFWSRADIGQVPFVCFFFSGFLVWNFFQNGVNRAMTSLSGYLQMLNQIYFPREVVLLVRLSEDLFDSMFAFMVAVLLNMVFGIFPGVHYIFLPLIFLILIGLVLGVGLFISCLSIMVRDIPQLIGVVLRLLFYLTPVIYPLTIVSGKVRFFLLINPLTSLVVAFRDIVVYNRMPNFLNLAYPIVLAGILVYTGFSFFKSREPVIVDYL